MIKRKPFLIVFLNIFFAFYVSEIFSQTTNDSNNPSYVIVCSQEYKKNNATGDWEYVPDSGLEIPVYEKYMGNNNSIFNSYEHRLSKFSPDQKQLIYAQRKSNWLARFKGHKAKESSIREVSYLHDSKSKSQPVRYPTKNELVYVFDGPLGDMGFGFIEENASLIFNLNGSLNLEASKNLFSLKGYYSPGNKTVEIIYPKVGEKHYFRECSSF